MFFINLIINQLNIIAMIIIGYKIEMKGVGDALTIYTNNNGKYGKMTVTVLGKPEMLKDIPSMTDEEFNLLNQ